MYKILIVEDDLGISNAIKLQAETWNFDVKLIKDFNNVLAEFSEFEPHIVLMDISLPFFDGYYWCKKIRDISKVPIIFISSATDKMNIIMTINMGADDFISKPFDMNVLIAKIQALLRRTYDFTSTNSILEHKGAFLNTEDNTLTFNDKKIDLTKNDYKILLCLMTNKGKVVSREELMEQLWETDVFIDENTLTVNVNRLRKKLDNVGLKNFISTKFGIGYIVK